MSAKTYVKKTAKKTARRGTRAVVKGTAYYIKYMIAYAIMAAIGGAIIAFLGEYGIDLGLDAIAISAIAYFAVGTLVLRRRLSVGRVIKLGRGLGFISRKMF